MSQKVWTIFFLAFALVGCFKNKPPLKSADPKIGEKLYRINCLSCHGKSGLSSRQTGVKVALSQLLDNENAFLKVVQEGRDGTLMKGFNTRLGKLEIESVRLYLKQSGLKKDLGDGVKRD